MQAAEKEGRLWKVGVFEAARIDWRDPYLATTPSAKWFSLDYDARKALCPPRWVGALEHTRLTSPRLRKLFAHPTPHTQLIPFLLYQSSVCLLDRSLPICCTFNDSRRVLTYPTTAEFRCQIHASEAHPAIPRHLPRTRL
jgi:hypothetical protein